MCSIMSSDSREIKAASQYFAGFLSLEIPLFEVLSRPW